MHYTTSTSKQFQLFKTFDELVHTSFYKETNAFCWEREIKGDFEEIVQKLQLNADITEVTTTDLLALNLSEEGNLARAVILNDLALLTNFGASPSLNLLKCYARDDEFDFISTDVYSYHVDRN